MLSGVISCISDVALVFPKRDGDNVYRPLNEVKTLSWHSYNLNYLFMYIYFTSTVDFSACLSAGPSHKCYTWNNYDKQFRQSWFFFKELQTPMCDGTTVKTRWCEVEIGTMELSSSHHRVFIIIKTLIDISNKFQWKMST